MATICGWLSKLRLRVTTWVRHYIFFCKSALLISVLVFAHGLVEYGLVAILIDYLTDNWENQDLPKAAAIVNVQEGLSHVLRIVVAHIADAYIGRFLMVLISTGSYVVGLLLLWLLTPIDNLGMLIVAVLLIALGTAGREPPLNAFLADQLRNKEKSLNNIDEKRVEDRTMFWWRFPSFIGAVVATFVLDPISWKKRFQISVVVMGVAFLLFLFGFRCYYREKPTGSPLTTVFKVFWAAKSKRHLPYSNEPRDYYKNDSDHIPLLPDISFSRWLDKAAIVESSSLSTEEQEKKWRLCRVTQVMEVKLFLRMVPMWTTFGVYCLVAATGSTFFFEQNSNLNDRIGKNDFRVPIVSLYLMKSFVKYTISYVYALIVPNQWSNAQKRRAMKVRIGVGLLCSSFCCMTARLVEVRRLNLVEVLDDPNEIIPMSIFWLAPQFCLLGLMEGLTEDGLVDFFYYQITDSMKSYGPQFNEFVLGIGKFLSIFWVLTFRMWFGESINDSRLDNYYGILAILSLVNLSFVYGYVSEHIYKEGAGEEMNLDRILQDVARGSASYMS